MLLRIYVSYKSASILPPEAVKQAAQGIAATPEKRQVGRFYRIALQGAFLEWAEEGTKKQLRSYGHFYCSVYASQ